MMKFCFAAKKYDFAVSSNEFTYEFGKRVKYSLNFL